MTQQLALPDDAVVGAWQDGLWQIAPDVAWLRVGFVNVAFIGAPGMKEWLLVDAGLPGSAGRIRRAAQRRFGDAPPAAILLTHGHFDHVGALPALLRAWRAPVFAHKLEAPYLNGTASYPPADTASGGGLMARLSALYPRGPKHVGAALERLPEDGGVPGAPGWRWLHTPGHSVGHVSFWRGADRLLIAGDAFVTTAPESAYAATFLPPEMHGPPRYFTHNWPAARESVARLAALSPALAITGHGRAVGGTALAAGLRELAERFDAVALPESGRNVARPNTAEDGSAYR